MHSLVIWYFRKDRKQEVINHVGILCGKTDAGDWIAVHCSSGKNGVTVRRSIQCKFPLYPSAVFLSDRGGSEADAGQQYSYQFRC